MKQLTINLDLFGPYIRELYEDQLILGFGVHPDITNIKDAVYYIVSDETASVLVIRTPPGAIVETKTMGTLGKLDKDMANLIKHLDDEEFPEIILDFTE